MSDPVSDTRTLHRPGEPLPTTQSLGGHDGQGSSLAGAEGAAIYRRTELGEKAVEQASRRISRPAQRALNLFDGIRPLRELPRIFGDEDLPAILRELVDGGLIEQILWHRIHHSEPAITRIFPRCAGNRKGTIDARTIFAKRPIHTNFNTTSQNL